MHAGLFADMLIAWARGCVRERVFCSMLHGGLGVDTLARARLAIRPGGMRVHVVLHTVSMILEIHLINTWLAGIPRDGLAL
jgi:hypothetical protein